MAGTLLMLTIYVMGAGFKKAAQGELRGWGEVLCLRGVKQAGGLIAESSSFHWRLSMADLLPH